MEEVGRIVLGLYVDQPLEVVAVGSPDAFLALVHHEVHVSAPGRVWVQRRPVLLGPFGDDIGIGRVRVDASPDRRPSSIAVAEGKVRRPWRARGGVQGMLFAPRKGVIWPMCLAT